MNRANGLWLGTFCTMICFLGSLHSCSTKPVYAQQSTGTYNDGLFYISASVNVDSNHTLYVSGSMAVEFDYYEDVDSIELDAYARQDGGVFASGYDEGNDYFPAGVSGQFASVPTGHTYSMTSYGSACFYDDSDDEDEGDYYCEPVGIAYASVYVPVPAPHIDSLNPSSVNQGDNGTLTISGSNLVENAADQLTINYSGSGMPFTLSGTPSSGMANFSYNFSMYDVGTYTVSVTNNEGTSNSVNFTVNPPLNACSQSTIPNAVTLQITGLGSVTQGGTFTIFYPTAVVSNATTTVGYGPFSTPSSVAASVATTITRNYAYQGITAQSNGPNFTVQSRSTFGSVSVSSSGASASVGVPSSVSCIIPPNLPCLGLFPSYDTEIKYRNGPKETARAHIIRRHIANTPSVGTTVYANTVGNTEAQMFNQVVRWNRVTYLFSPGTNGIYTLHFGSFAHEDHIHDLIGTDVSGNDLYTNKLVLSSDHCSVITSYPIAP